MNMDEGYSQNHIIFFKYKEEENMKKFLIGMKDKKKTIEITKIEERRIDRKEV